MMMRTMVNSKWRGREQVYVTFSSFACSNFTTRETVKVVQVCKINMSKSSTKKANLFAAKKERIKLPNYDNVCMGKAYHIREFLRQPSGIESMLNASALESFQSLDPCTYRCTLHAVRLLNVEVTPILDLRVTSTHEDCTVEMLSCKFKGSNIAERQNKNFSAFMRNHMTWYTSDSDSFLEVDVKLNLTLEIYILASAIEGAGNLAMQALLDRMVQLLLQQVLQDYDKWIHQQCKSPLQIRSSQNPRL